MNLFVKRGTQLKRVATGMFFDVADEKTKSKFVRILLSELFVAKGDRMPVVVLSFFLCRACFFCVLFYLYGCFVL
jgi:hypothetical protein